MSAASATIVPDRASIVRITAAGSVAGGINATLCVLDWPVPAAAASFRWHLIPAGMAHGGLLALAAIAGLAVSSRPRLARWRWLAAPIIGWLGGYTSWVPLEMSIFDQSLSDAFDGRPGVPYTSPSSGIRWSTLAGSAPCSNLWLVSGAGRHSRKMAIFGAALAGSLGSLCWWIEWSPWYFSLLHGGVWGILVGFAAVPRGRNVMTQSSPLFLKTSPLFRIPVLSDLAHAMNGAAAPKRRSAAAGHVDAQPPGTAAHQFDR
jgi:hypothetical protein